MSLPVGEGAQAALSARLGPTPNDPEVYADEWVGDDAAGFGVDDTAGGGDVNPNAEPSPVWGSPVARLRTLRDPAAYHAGGREPWLTWSPDAALRQGLPREQCQAYRRTSADVTMRGGTTSGVIYPLAICEIARRYRLRNIGGASAGAIAAAAAAAAEVGRVRGPKPAGDLGEPEAASTLADDDRQAGHVRSGFAGLADTVAWLAQCDDDRTPLDEYRVARLFQPSSRGRPWLRLAAAAMSGHADRVPLLLAGAMGRRLLTVLLLLIGVAIAVLGYFDQPDQVVSGLGPVLGWPVGLLAAAVGVTWPLVGVCIAAIQRVRTVTAPKPAEPVAALRDFAEESPSDPRPVRPNPCLWAAIPLSAVAAVLLAWLAGYNALAVIVASTGVAVVTVTLFVLALTGLIGHAKDAHFGVVPGSTPSDPGVPERWPTGPDDPVPAPVRPLVQWLSDTFSELARQPGRVLCFRDLWGAGDPTTGEAAARASARLAEQARDPWMRQVNLQLVTSELTQNRCYTFPLPTVKDTTDHEGSALYFRVEDLARIETPGGPAEGVFPVEVVVHMLRATGEVVPARDERTGECFTLYRLPEPWDLPVIVAVRLSLSLPFLFEAVRLYRLVPRATRRDNFGRAYASDAVTHVPVPDPHGRSWARELWFTDGGITSNFPIHLFDTLLPTWPTFGINLGNYPPGFSSQDVWLPDDQQGFVPPGSPVGASLASFGGAIVSTARAWRDMAQTLLPAQRGRVAWVRQRPWEGGSNLYMTRETITGLALRGALAGARLRRRFHPELPTCDLAGADAVGAGDVELSRARWNRHQWLRLRSGMAQLSKLSRDADLARGDEFYEALLDTSPPSVGNGDAAPVQQARLDQLIDQVPGDPDPPRADSWFLPAPSFWLAAANLARLFSSPDQPSPLEDGSPQPCPELKQTPP